MDQLVQWVDEKVTAELSASLGAAIGSAGGPVFAVIGAAIGAAVGALIDLFTDIWNDDMFKPATIELEIPSADARFPGDQTHGGDGLIRFKGHGR